MEVLGHDLAGDFRTTSSCFVTSVAATPSAGLLPMGQPRHSNIGLVSSWRRDSTACTPRSALSKLAFAARMVAEMCLLSEAPSANAQVPASRSCALAVATVACKVLR